MTAGAIHRIIGDGSIGDKARELVEKSAQLADIGFHAPQRTILAQGFFEPFFERNLIPFPAFDALGLEARVRDGSLNAEQFGTLREIAQRYDAPLAVRSSAEGDARGTGTYRTDFTDANVGRLRKSLLAVLASYFSLDAVYFRRDARTGEGFGIIIEPIIGQAIGDLFAPVLSGYGYTSTSRGEGYINVVPGLGGGVDTRDGERITASALDAFGGNLYRYICDQEDKMRFDDVIRRNSALLGMNEAHYVGYRGNAYVPVSKRRKNGFVGKVSIDIEEHVGEAFRQLNLSPLFGMMHEMERRFGTPQYFEWALTLEKDDPRFWITQIAGVDKRLDILDFSDSGEALLMAHTVTGTGVRECNKIAFCWNPSEVAALYDFNQRNADYALLYSSRLTSRPIQGVRKLTYSDFSNASVFLEIQDAPHAGDPVAHLGGQLDMAGKLFGVLDYDAEIPPQWDAFHARERDEGGMRVYDGRVKVLASERQNRLVVTRID